jgi:hypothetical protein
MGSLQGESAMGIIEIVIGPEDNATISSIDLLDDYWSDFLIFRNEARISHQNGDLLRTQRYLRSGLFSFLNYLAGLVNRWEESADGTGNDRSIPIPTPDRLVKVATQFRLQHPPRADIDFLSGLAARCANLNPSDEKDLSQALSFSDVDAAEARIVAWLDEFADASGLKLHSDARASALDFANALGVITTEDYRCFDALKDDPLAFQDPPGTWEEEDKPADDGRSSEG